MKTQIGLAAKQRYGFWYANRFLLLRRFCQLSILALFLLGPLTGIWFINGNLSSSIILDTVPLTDPYVFLQILLSGHVPELNAIIGVSIVVGVYLFVGGRVYCSWVCPVNIVTDFAAWLRNKLGINANTKLSKNLRNVILLTTLLLPLVVGYVVWEMVNPVSLLHRGLIFGIGYGWSFIVAIFLLDLYIVHRGWCGHLCPMGAFYSYLGVKRPLKVNAINRDACNNCGDCYLICPEPEVLKLPLRNKSGKESSLIKDKDCTNCGRCIDVCEPKVFEFTLKS